MSHPGVAPKDADQRRRAAAPTRGEWIDLPEKGTFKAVLPAALPKRDPKTGGWHRRTKEAWAAWRADPVSTQWSDADIQLVREFVFVYDEWVRGRYNLSAEVRQFTDRLGLNPKGKRDLRYRPTMYVEAIQATERRRAAGKKSTSRQSRLSVVK